MRDTTARQTGHELTIDELQRISGGGLSRIIIPFTPPPPGPPVHLQFGPLG